ncbi:MAG: hypothetical protein IOMNBAOH_01715 [Rhodocyclaceae bacterium]|nr:hypothetical protein [Rhodocyclaceae bacterium]
MRALAKSLVLTFVALVVALGVAEVVVRLAMSDTIVLFPRYHTDYVYGPYRLRGIRPAQTFVHSSVDGRWEFRTNRAGFRNDEEFSYEKPAGVYRVLVLGDSHTQGYEVRQEASYAEVLKRALAAGGRKVEVLNTGVSGFGTAEELAFLENAGARYQPDAVVVGFFSNDYEDNLKAGLFSLDAQGRLVPRKFEHIPGVRIQNAIYAIPGIKWLSEHSHFYSLLFNTVWVYFKYFAPVAKGEVQRVVPEFAVPTHQQRSEEEVALAASLLARMQAYCNSKGIRLLVVDIPTVLGRYQIESSVVPALRDRIAPAGIELVTSESLFSAYGGVVDLHLPHGYHHISEFSHALIGVELGRRLMKPAKPGW